MIESEKGVPHHRITVTVTLSQTRRGDFHVRMREPDAHHRSPESDGYDNRIRKVPGPRTEARNSIRKQLSSSIHPHTTLALTVTVTHPHHTRSQVDLLRTCCCVSSSISAPFHNHKRRKILLKDGMPPMSIIGFQLHTHTLPPSTKQNNN